MCCFTGLQQGLFVVGLRYIKKVVHSISHLVHLANEANEIDIIYIGAVQTEVRTQTLPSVYSSSVAMITPQNIETITCVSE